MNRALQIGSMVLACVLPSCGDDAGSSGAGGATSSTSSTSTGAGVGGAAEGTGTGGEDVGASGGGGGGSDRVETRVFVTSLVYGGDHFGGLEGADAECQALADGVSLGGTWIAWLSDSSMESPSTRFSPSPLPYVLVGGDEIAADWDDLVDATLAVPIDRDEAGEFIVDTDTLVWTGTTPGGTGTSCCLGWTSTEVGSAAGRTTAVDSLWTWGNGQPCDGAARLYCFEQ